MTGLGLDLTEGVRAVAVDADGRTLARGASPDRTGQSALEMLKAVRPDAGPTTLGVASAGPRAEVASLLGSAWQGAPTVPPGEALLLAETWCGGARGASHVVVFAIGDQVVAGASVGGVTVRGANDCAMGVGWMAVNPVERDDYRRFGGLGAEIASAGIVRRLVWRVKSGDHSTVVDDVDGDLAQIGPVQVFAAARRGDGVARAVVRDTARYVGMAIANLATLLDPECVVVGGLLASEHDLLLEPVRVECLRRMEPQQGERLRLIVSELGPDAVAIGAARAALVGR